MEIITQWQSVTTYLGAAYSLKQDDKLPDYILALTRGTLAYEQAIKAAWIDFKRNPTEANAQKFASFLKTYSGKHWPEVVKSVLGVPTLSPQQQKMLEDALGEHHEYVMTSLLPDMLKAASADNLNAMDHRAIFLYAGALWSFGLLATVMFDGLEVRDLADLFLFAGPNDAATCKGERGCEQYAGKVFTVAQILADNIVPGKLRCVTNCRHMLLPIASPLNKPKVPKQAMYYGQWQSEFKHLPGRHDQHTHAPNPSGNAFGNKDFPEEAAYRRYAEDLALRLSESTGLSPEKIYAVMKAYDFQPAANTYAGSAIVESVSRVFGVELSDYEKQKIADRKETASTIPKKWIRTDYKVNGYSEYDRPLNPDQMDRLVTQIYEDTQSYLRDRNVTELTLYRGDKEKHNNVLMSYTTDIPTAEHFGTLTTDTVPVEHVLSLPMTGFGVSEQYEVTVLKLHEEALKHLAGQHNQLDHGRKRAGEQRRLADHLPDDYMGSPSGLSKPIEPLEQNNNYDPEMIDLKAINNYFQDVSVHDASNAEEKSSWAIAEDITSSPVIDTAWPMLSQYFIDSWERKRWKNTVVTALSEDTGLDYDRVSDLVKTWSDTSNDNNPTSLGLQMAAHEEFGTPLTKWQQEKIEKIITPIASRAPTLEKVVASQNEKVMLAALDDGRKFLRAMYDRTQKEFEAAGIENVLLYRGAIRIEKGTEPETWPKLYGQQELEENAMESWSLSFQTASSFAHSFEGIGGHGLPGMEGIEGVHFQNPEKLTEVGVVYQAVIPRERILCTPKTGMGCLSEFEFVVLGSDAKDEARVVGRYQGD